MVVRLLEVRDQGATVIEHLLNMFVSMCSEHVQNNLPCTFRHRSGHDSRARQGGRYRRRRYSEHVVNMWFEHIRTTLYLLKLECSFGQATKCYVACIRILTHSEQVHNSLGLITQCLRNLGAGIANVFRTRWRRDGSGGRQGQGSWLWWWYIWLDQARIGLLKF